MTLDNLIKQVYASIVEWLDKKPTGMLKIEMHARKGGIGKVYKEQKDEVIEDKTD